MKHLFTALIFMLSLPLFSQDEAEKEKPKRICRILFPEKPEDAPDEAYLFDGIASQKVSLPAMNFSEVIELPEGPLILGMTSNKVETPEDFPVAAPTVKIPENVKDLYLMVISDPGNKVLPVRLQPINVDDSKLKVGETLWINLTEHKLAAKLGVKQVVIPASGQIVSEAPLRDNGYYQAQFAYQANAEGPLLPIMKKSWWFDARSKNLGFIIDSGGRLPKIFTFRDHRAPKNKGGAKNPG